MRPGEPLPISRSRYLARQQAKIADLKFFANKVGISTSLGMRGAGGELLASAAAARCWASVSDPHGMEALRAKSRAWGCLMSRPC